MARRHIIPLFIPHWGCPYHCVYCDQRTIASRVNQIDVARELSEALRHIPPGTHPVEVAFYGGTFTALPLNLQERLLSEVRSFMTEERVDSIRLSTHPACISESSLDILTAYKVMTVELGVQSMDPAVLKASGRDYGPQTVAAAVEKLKQRKFTVGIQLMPGLPGDTKEKTLDSTRKVIELEPDFVRVYPTVVIDGTELAELWRKGEYEALGLEEAVDWCKEISLLFAAAGIPIIRMGLHPSRELEEKVLAGPYHPAFKALVNSALALDRIKAQLEGNGDKLTLFCNPKDIPVVRGHSNSNLSKLTREYGFKSVEVKPEPELALGKYRVILS